MKNRQSIANTTTFKLFALLAMAGQVARANDVDIYFDCVTTRKPGDISSTTTCASNLLLTFEFLNGSTYLPDDDRVKTNSYALPPCLVDGTIVKLTTDPGVNLLRVPLPNTTITPIKVCDDKFRISFFPYISSGNMASNDSARRFQDVADCVALDLQTPRCELSTSRKGFDPTVLISSMFGATCSLVLIGLIVGGISAHRRKNAREHIAINDGPTPPTYGTP